MVAVIGLLIIQVHVWELVTFKTSKVSSANYSSHIKTLSLFSILLKLCFIALCRGNYISLRTINFSGQVILCCGDCPMCCWMLKQHPWPLSGMPVPQGVTAKNVSGHCTMSPGGKTAPVKNHWSSNIHKREFSKIPGGSPAGGWRFTLATV